MKQPTSIQATSILPHDRQRNDKLRTFAKFAFSMNGSAQCLNHIVYVCQAQAKALHIVAVASMHAIELVENLFQVIAFNADTIVFDSYYHPARLVVSRYKELQVSIRSLILHRVIHQVEYHIGKVHFIYKHNAIIRIEVRINRSP